ncbi:NAD(P)-dependent oxidoreductase [Shewanella sp. VB17]|uniref:NAD(P)-dependent oxidoreductase n=1 Tax=Shewanella sp. VB17 TaxID=2739432 RepID=UPI0015644423|nr:NAD(P)-dependent oxidoreductase [Shewanella sp. VB17]NRD74353.1 NAD(P)-dependent oxidoreductase [Shewanella sp. VB17]
MSIHQCIESPRLSDAEIIANFTDISPPLTKKQVLVESERCLFCYDAPCIKACPTGIDIPLFIRKINTGNLHGAGKEVLSANILGGTCARVCPTETLCEDVCVRNSKEHAPVAIGLLQRYAVEQLDPQRDYPFSRAPDTGKHIAVVGAGPAGLACAHRLAREGHQITIYESTSKTGGLNEYGIAVYKLVDNYAQQEVDFVLQIGGITIQYDTALGKQISLKALRMQYDSVFLGIGMGSTNALNIPGEEYPGVEDAVEYIYQLRQTQSMGNLPVGRQVLVIGGGMTAIDIAVQSKKLGAEEVTIVYRRDMDSMGASDHEKDLAYRHGVRFICHAQPLEIIGDNKGITSMSFTLTGDHQHQNVSQQKEIITLPCDVVFKAIGQKFDKTSLANEFDDMPTLCQRGRLAVDHHFKTSLDDVYAGGDCINGKDLVVEAVDHGNKAALAIHQKLQGERS